MAKKKNSKHLILSLQLKQELKDACNSDIGIDDTAGDLEKSGQALRDYTDVNNHDGPDIPFYLVRLLRPAPRLRLAQWLCGTDGVVLPVISTVELNGDIDDETKELAIIVGDLFKPENRHNKPLKKELLHKARAVIARAIEEVNQHT